MVKRFVFVVIICITILTFCISCSSTKPYSNCGVVVLSLNRFDTTEKVYKHNEKYWPDKKVWYKDSFIIQRIPTLSMSRIGNNVTREVGVKCYTFIDLGSKSFYEYSSFSDTATLLRKYTQPDSVDLEGGWNFWRSIKVNLREDLLPLMDTIINGINNKRVRFRIGDTKTQSLNEYIGYFRCDKKGSLFQLNKKLSEEIGCPLVRVDEVLTPQSPIGYSELIEFVSSELTSEESKVIIAWQRYAKENPVR
jgi:hypothetical protein